MPSRSVSAAVSARRVVSSNSGGQAALLRVSPTLHAASSSRQVAPVEELTIGVLTRTAGSSPRRA